MPLRVPRAVEGPGHFDLPPRRVPSYPAAVRCCPAPGQGIDPTGANLGGVSERTLTVEETAARLGVTPKAVRRRIERGTLPAILGRDGRRRVPAAALDPGAMGSKQGPREPRSGQLPRDPGAPGQLDAASVLARLEQLAAENGRLRALTEVAESSRAGLEDEVHQLRARVRELEAPRRGWFRRQ